jgi:membrane protein required for colicin V production
VNWVDFAILGVLLLSVAIGLFRGFVKEIMGLIVWIAAFWVAWQFCDEGALFLVDHVDVPSARLGIAFGLLLLLALISGALLNYLVQALVESTGLTGTDRLLGLFFGAGRGLVLLVAAVLLAGLTPLPQDPWWQESRLIPTIQELAEWVSEAMPPEVAGYFEFETAPAAEPAPAQPDAGST